MFDYIKKYIKKRKTIKEFYKEHKDTLPKFSPHGQLLEWNVFIYQEGDYDIYTGIQDGKYKIGILQKCPCGGIMFDTQVYGYDINTKKLIEIHGCHWQ